MGDKMHPSKQLAFHINRMDQRLIAFATFLFIYPNM